MHSAICSVYNLSTKEGTCVLTHEVQPRVGACEIASNLHTFLVEEGCRCHRLDDMQSEKGSPEIEVL